MSNDSIQKVFLVAFSLCVVCAVLVSSAAVGLKPIQERNKSQEIKKNILIAAGLMKDGADVDKLFKKVEVKIVDLKTGEYTEAVDVKTFDQKKAAKDPAMNYNIPGDKDVAKIKQRSKYANVYLLRENGAIKRIILPVHGKGLWSTMYGFLALDSSTNEIQRFAFYSHGETPGLGGEVDNPKWKDLWIGKQVFDKDFNVKVKVIKGNVNPDSADAKYQVDGLSGATLTCNGVTGVLHYWLSQDGFGKYLAKIRGGQNG